MFCGAIIFSGCASVQAEPKRVLVVSTTTGFRHSSIALAEKVIAELGVKSGDFTVEFARVDPNSPEYKGADGKVRAGMRTGHPHGQRGVPAETVADQACDALQAWLGSAAQVGEHLADQLLLPMALGPGGRFRTCAPSPQTLTQIETLQLFLGVSPRCEKVSDTVWEIEVPAP